LRAPRRADTFGARTSRAAIYCETCQAEWSEAQCLQIVTTRGAIKWRQTRPFMCCAVRQEPMVTRKWQRDNTPDLKIDFEPGRAMLLSQTQIQTRIDALRKARDTGALIARHRDPSTQFRSLKEIESILADLEQQLATLQDTTRPRVRYFRQDSKGF
jgi:hypothetical protein